MSDIGNDDNLLVIIFFCSFIMQRLNFIASLKTLIFLTAKNGKTNINYITVSLGE